MPVIIKLPRPDKPELINHLLAEKSGVGALDAYQGQVIASQQSQIITATEELQRKMGIRYDIKLKGNDNTFYPCVIQCPLEETTVTITRQMHEDVAWEGGLRAKLRFGKSLSETYPRFEAIDYYIIDKKCFIAGIEQYNDTNPILYLRGNRTYHFVINSDVPPTIYYEKTEFGTHSIEPRTTIDDVLKRSVYPVQGQLLATPLQGTILTNNIPPKTNTRANQITLQSGTYLLTAHVTYSGSFDQTVVHWLLNGEGSQLVVNRGTASSGGGTTPFMIYQVTKPMSIYSCVFQASDSNRTLDKNTLTALRMA